MHQIEFWFDFGSPYAYFGALEIEEVAERHGRAVQWHPFMLGAVFSTTGMGLLTETPLRGDYARHDWQRLARKLSAPFALPPGFPVHSANAGRAFYWLRDHQPDIAIPFAKAVFHSYFGEGIDGFDKNSVLRTAAECGADIVELRLALDSDMLKKQFRVITDEAIARGVFGSPFFFVDSEPFWGWDRLALVDEWLNRGGW
ncbi:MAG: 2-hydroxychromene-2-carboxylate isomerase [Bradyrhizobium sp.]